MFLLALASALAPSSPPAQDTPAIRPTIRIGDQVAGDLPLVLEVGRNRARRAFELELECAGMFTATLGSLDFDAWLSIEDLEAGSAREDRASGAATDAWLVYEATRPGRLLVQVGAEDDRGGEFELSIRPGRVDPPRGPVEWGRATLAHCRRAAARAEEGGEVDRALRLQSDAWQYAYWLEDLPVAREIAERQFRLSQAEDRPFEAIRARAHLGAVERRLGNSAAAQAWLDDALGPAERALADAAETADQRQAAALLTFVYDNLGDLRSAAGNPREALALYRKEAEAAGRTGNPAVESLAWQHVGRELDRLGEMEEACQAMERALASVWTGPPEALASARLHYGRILSDHGRSAEAREQCERALELPAFPATRIELLGTAAGAYIGLGRYEQARAALDQLDALCAEHGISGYEIPVLIDRALIAHYLGGFSAARQMLEEALALQEASESTQHRIEILLDLGLVLKVAGRSEEARARYEQALRACESAGDRSRQVSVLVDGADLSIQVRDHPAALADLDRAVDLAEQLGETASAAMARSSRGYVLFLMGDLQAAREIALGAAAELDSLGKPEWALDARDTLARIGLAQADLGAVEEALCAADRLLGSQDEQRLDLFSSAGLRSRFADWGGIAQDLVARRLEAAGPDGPERARVLSDGWEEAGKWKGRVLLDRMRGSGPDDVPRPRIEPGAAVIDYVDGLDDLYAYVALAEGVRFVDLGERAPIEEQARRFVEAVSGAASSSGAVAELGSDLYHRLVSPLLPWLPAGTEVLVVAPTPALAVLPFEALVQPVPGEAHRGRGFDEQRYLIDDFAVVYSPSSPVLAELQRRGPTGREHSFLILGDPVYRLEATGKAADDQVALARLGSELMDFGRVKATRQEAWEIARMLLVRDRAATDEQRTRLLEIPGRRSDRLATARFDLRLGDGVRREVFAGELTGFTTLHIAVHGHVDTDDPRRSGLVLSYEPETHGLFPLEDLLALRLDADLVVLSACDTARGPIVRGEGVQSLSWAFLQAGARSVIGSLWRVEDRDAADLMKSFYASHLDEGLHPALALRRAKLELRRSREARGVGVSGQDQRTTVAANPYFWAPFVYVGAPPE